MATRRRKQGRTASSRRRTARPRTHRRPPGADVATIVIWTAFAVAGLVLAAGAVAFLADDIPYEDRQIRDMRLRLRNRARSASADAFDALKSQFADLQSDVRRQLAQLR